MLASELVFVGVVFVGLAHVRGDCLASLSSEAVPVLQPGSFNYYDTCTSGNCANTQCPPGSEVTSAAECLAAAGAVGLPYMGHAGNEWMMGCIHHEVGNGVYFAPDVQQGTNSHDSGHICRATQLYVDSCTDAPCVNTSCPLGLEIENAEDCGAASMPGCKRPS